MSSEFKPEGDLFCKGAALLDAAKEYWEEYQKVGKREAVVWLQGDDGALVMFTRGEYAKELKATINNLER